MTSLITLVLLMWKWMGALYEQKSYFKMLWLTLDWIGLNWIGTLTSSQLLKLAPRKLEPWFVLRSFFSLAVVLYLFKSTIWPCLEFCCCVWDGATNCYLELLDALQKRIYRTVSPLLAVSFETLPSSSKCSQCKSFL